KAGEVVGALALVAVTHKLGLAAAEEAGGALIEVRTPTVTEGVEVADALAWERRAVEALKSGGYKTKPAVVIGRFDPATGEAGAFSSRGGLGNHAEDVAKEAMPNGVFSRPISVRGGVYADVCPACEATH